MTQDNVEVPFGREPRARRGYDPRAVDDFVSRARASFHDGSREVTSDVVRTTSFPLIRGGYTVPSVDTALARLEDAFARQEREREIAAGGADEWVSAAREEAREILARLTRPEGARFDRVRWHRSGYSVTEVDIVAARIARYLSRGEPVTPDQLRSAAFRLQRGGYREEQVDAVLDAAIRVILAVR